jgi:hypothetical protein
MTHEHDDPVMREMLAQAARHVVIKYVSDARSLDELVREVVPALLRKRLASRGPEGGGVSEDVIISVMAQAEALIAAEPALLSMKRRMNPFS